NRLGMHPSSDRGNADPFDRSKTAEFNTGFPEFDVTCFGEGLAAVPVDDEVNGNSPARRRRQGIQHHFPGSIFLENIEHQLQVFPGLLYKVDQLFKKGLPAAYK